MRGLLERGIYSLGYLRKRGSEGVWRHGLGVSERACERMRWAGDVSDKGLLRFCERHQQRSTSHCALGGASVLMAPGSVCDRETR